MMNILNNLQQQQKRTYRYSIILLVLVLLVTMLGVITPTPTAKAWQPIPGVQPGSGADAFWPRTYVDSTGMVHAVWHIFDGSGTVMYARGQFNADASGIEWYPAVKLSQYVGQQAWDNTARIAVDGNGVVHVIFIGRNDSMYYLYSPDRGANWAAETFGLGERAWTPAIAVDDSSVAYVTWSSGIGNSDGDAWYTFRSGPNQWVSPQKLTGSAYLMRNNQIGVNAYDGKVYLHMMYDYIPKEHNDSRVFYSRGNPLALSPAIDMSSNYAGFSQADNGSVAVDMTVPGRIYASFVHGSSEADYMLYFSTSDNNGLSWSPFIGLNIGLDVWPEQNALFGYGNIAHLVSEQKYWSGNGFSTILIWYHQYNAATGQTPRIERISAEEKSTKPDIWGGGVGKYAVWVRGNTDNVMYNYETLEGGAAAATPTPTTPAVTPTNTPVPGTPTPTPTPTVPPDQPVGKIKIGNGEPLIKDTTTLVSMILESGTAHQYKIWNSGSSEPAYSDIPNGTLTGPDVHLVEDWSVFEATDPESFPCNNVTVNGKFKNTDSGKTSGDMSAAVIVDPGVDADVTVSNPSAGASAYTSQLFYMLQVQARSGECSKLVAMEVGEQTEGAALSDMTLRTAANGMMPLIPGTSAVHTILVKLTDGVGNEQTYERTITVDTQAPQLATDSAKLVAADNTTDVLNSILVDLDFEGISVTDDMYGTQPDESHPFWGVSIANSREEIAAANTAQLDALNWQAVEVNSADIAGTDGSGVTFTVSDWNLFNGLSQDQQNGGNFYIYARVMDGAGNASTATLKSNTIALSDNFVLPTPTPTPTTIPTSTPTEVPSTQLKVYLPVVLR